MWLLRVKWALMAMVFLTTKTDSTGAGEMAQWLGVLAALLEDWGSIPSIHTRLPSNHLFTYNPSSMESHALV